VTRPEDALAQARAAAAAMRERGAYGDDLRGFEIEPADAVTQERLLEWAVIEPDPAQVYSTRRLGAPITWVKRLMLRALRQYHGQLLAEQTRFNLQLSVYLSELDSRVRDLEELAVRQSDEGPPAP
jgi:hypothetical protein